MKKLIFTLMASFLFLAGNALAGTWTAHIEGTPIIDFSMGLALPVPNNTFVIEMTGDTLSTADHVTNMNWPAGVIATCTAPPAEATIPAPSTDLTDAMTIMQVIVHYGSGSYYEQSSYLQDWNKTTADPTHGLFDAILPAGTTYHLAIYGVTIATPLCTNNHIEGLVWISQSFTGGASAAGGYKWYADKDCDDPDNDGVCGENDTCPDTPDGEDVDANGCSASQLTDTDGDGVTNDIDNCPDTPAGEDVDANGCSLDQRTDTDGDGVMDAYDTCPDTPDGEDVDANGCSASQTADNDNDGVLDNVDACLNTPAGATVDADGCADSQKDTDGDEVMDDVDNCKDVSNPGQEDGDNDGTGLACEGEVNAVCASTKLKAIAAYALGLINCEAKGTNVDACDDKVAGKFETIGSKTGAWDKAQLKADKDKKNNNCDTGPIDEILTDVNAALDDIYGQINTVIGNGDKTSAKVSSTMLKALGKLCSAQLKAESAYVQSKTKDAGKATTAFNNAITNASKAYDTSFGKMQAKYGSVYDFDQLDNLNGDIETLVGTILSDMNLSH